jgi:hypothetical protein
MKPKESKSKTKSRINRLEQNIAKGYNHRLALSYASNQLGDLPGMAKDAALGAVLGAESSRTKTRTTVENTRLEPYEPKKFASPLKEKDIEPPVTVIRGTKKSLEYP